MFPNNIKAEMARSDMTQQELANFLAVSASSVKNWFNGKSEIPSGALIKMAKKWNVTADYLLGLNSDKAS